jgi:tRNA 2-thiocytidine biosynthesis protein TtcA
MSEIDDIIQGKTLEAVRSYEMFLPGERILMALSGGKDSLTLVGILGQLRLNGELNAHLEAVWVETDAGCGEGVLDGPAGALCRSLEIPLRHIRYDIIEEAGEKLSCFYCALRRRSAMFKMATDDGFNSLAFGHHRDDVAETLVMNMLFHGNISTMSPAVSFFGGKLRVIRPLALVDERETARWVAERGLAAVACSCPRSAENIRASVKEWLAEIETEAPGVGKRIFDAMHMKGER